MNEPGFLQTFLQAYFTDAIDIGSAISSFARTEGSTGLQALNVEIKNALISDVSDEALKSLISATNLASNQHPREFLLNLYNSFLAIDITSSQRKPVDVFVSYSSADKNTAAMIVAGLQKRGFSTFWSDDDVLQGHTLYDEHYKGIRSSEILLILLERGSATSQWLKHDLDEAKINELHKLGTFVLVVRIGDAEIPSALNQASRLDVRSIDELSIAQLMQNIEGYRTRKALAAAFSKPPSAQQLPSDEIRQFAKDEGDRAVKNGWPPIEPFTEVIVMPKMRIAIPKGELRQIVDTCRVELKGWGGAPFPYLPINLDSIFNTDVGTGVKDPTHWPWTDFSYSWWHFTEGGKLFHRADLKEDHLTLNGTTPAKGQFNVIWAVKDVCMPIIFAFRLSRRLQTPEMAVRIRWTGMKDRKLSMFGTNRMPFITSRVCNTDEIIIEFNVNANADRPTLTAEALKQAKELFWMFNWEQIEVLRKDIESMIGGTFPQQ